MSYRVIAHSKSGEVAYRGTEIHTSYGAAEREARSVARRAGLTDVHVVKDGKRIVGEVKARKNPSWRSRYKPGDYVTARTGTGRGGGTVIHPISRSQYTDGSYREPHRHERAVYVRWKDGTRGWTHAENLANQGLARRRNPDIEALSWPPAWSSGGSKKDFKAYVAAKGMDAEVMCHGMRSVPGSLRDLPRAKYVVYGGTHNPNVKPAKWYATLDLTGATPKVS